jgi:hypothetical protein
VRAAPTVVALVFAFLWSANAQTFPIIDVHYGYLIGAIESGKWIEPTDATNSVKTGTKLQVYSPTGADCRLRRLVVWAS